MAAGKKDKLLKRALERVEGTAPTAKKRKTKNKKPLLPEPNPNTYEANLRYLQRSTMTTQESAMEKACSGL